MVVVAMVCCEVFFFWVEDKETLNLSRNRKKRYNGRDCLKIVGATAESLKRALRLN